MILKRREWTFRRGRDRNFVYCFPPAGHGVVYFRYNIELGSGTFFPLHTWIDALADSDRSPAVAQSTIWKAALCYAYECMR